MVEVIQSDRDAAATFADWLRKATLEWGNIEPFFISDFSGAVRKGVWDSHPVVQAFAAHRIEAEKRNNALAVELRALDAKATAGPWEVDTEKSEGEYGAGPDTTVGYDVSMIIGPDGLSLFDALNSTAASIQEEYDEDWRVSYDEVSARNAALIVALRNNLPAILAALEGDE